MLTCVELSGLILVILVGLYAMGGGRADFSRVVMFDSPSDKGIFLGITAGTSLAFFAMVGFEDSVNMAEETKDPVKVFPKIMLTGLTITGTIYVLVCISAVALVPPGELGDAPLVRVVEAGVPNAPVSDIVPLISMFAVANSALINMLMASRLLYGMANQRVLPPVLGRVLPGRRTPWVAILFTTVLAIGLLIDVSSGSNTSTSSPIAQLGGTTALLLLAVFTLVNVAVLVLRRETAEHQHFKAPTFLPVIAGLCTLYLVGPWTGRNPVQYTIAGILLAIGVALWLITWFINRAIYARKTYLRDPTELE